MSWSDAFLVVAWVVLFCFFYNAAWSYLERRR